MTEKMTRRTRWGKGAKSEKQGKKNWKKFWLEILLMVVWVFAAVVVAQLVVGYLMLFILGRDGFSSPVAQLFYSALSYVAALALIIFVPVKLFKRWKTDRKELGLYELPTWTDIGLAPVGFIVATILGAILVSMFSVFPWFDAEQAQNVGFSIYMSGGERILAFLALVIIAPIAEEIIFRGWLYGKLREKLSGKFSEITGVIISILITSVLFGLVHFQWNVGVNVFALSVVLCGLREVTGTIYASILTHILKNGIAFFLMFVIGIA
ncbi:MAG: CPBP family glutamic-type intramembrane protease [Candidatus Saccharibacteria bacterium]|nr:CPBP family glutamic-type intramembrane protease [Candidatus Saccharibacteria bacterium]